MRDIVHNIGASTALPPQTVAASAVNGSIIDTLGFNALAFVVTAANITDGTYVATLTEGNDSALADGSTVAAADILGTLPAFAANDDNVTKRVGYAGNKRYLRLTLTPTGATTGGLFAASAILGHPFSAPVV